MRGASSAWLVALFVAVLPACLPAGDPCCENDTECADGTRCFEGRCAPRCDDEAEQANLQCDEGERCVPVAGVCRAVAPEVELERCPYVERDVSR